MSNHIIRNTGIATALFCGVVAVDKIPWPSDLNVTSNLDGQAPMTTRTLAPRETTAHALTSGPTIPTTTVARPVDELTLVFDGRAITIHRSPATAPLFAYLEGMTR